MKTLALLGAFQICTLTVGLSVLASVTPHWQIDNTLVRWLVTLAAVMLILAGLTCRDYVREATRKKNDQ